jgi:hypothetical protein
MSFLIAVAMKIWKNECLVSFFLWVEIKTEYIDELISNKNERTTK